MKSLLPLATFLLFAPSAGIAAENPASRHADTVVLDENGVKNLRIRTLVVEPGEFEQTIFALGRIEVYPGSRAIVSSRVSGRAQEVRAKLDHAIERGDVALLVEGRQPGNPPPALALPAPLSGLVSAVHVVTGQPVEPDRALVEIVDLTRVYALARVPDHLAGRLRSGQHARIAVAAASGEVFPAELEHLGAFADPQNGTIEAAFRVANPALKLRPGMRAEFSIVTGKRTDVTAVPRSALQGTPAARFVYVKHFDLPHAFVKVPVVAGETEGDQVEIVSGLLPGDEVVTQGAYSLAFAGGGTLSLKEALDAAHGHEHAADGSELKPGASANNAHDDHGHSHAHGDHAHPERPWQIATAILAAFALFLTLALARRRHA